MSYCIYLRKSRADREAEEHGEGETLARHEQVLLSLARKQKLNITKIYREIVSGETIASRPQMQKLLNDVEQGFWQGVLVMEVERLARGDTKDQGIVADSFKYSNTKIITPLKTYDPNNEFDEEYFEFGLFMSRREYKTINRRLQHGRLTSVQEGKYLGSIAPYGYDRIKIKDSKGYTLIPNEESDIVKLIFQLYTVGNEKSESPERIGVLKICKYLNNLNIKPRKGDVWVPATIQNILRNPVYIGKIKWNSKPTVKCIVNGIVKKTRPRAKEYILVNGLHKAIINETVFNTAQKYINSNRANPIGITNTMKNPLSGLIKCGICGRNMVRRPYPNNKADILMCSLTGCNNVSSQLNEVEYVLLETLKEWLNEYKINWRLKQTKENDNLTVNIVQETIKKELKEKSKLENQLDNLHNLLEQNIYDTNKFLERSKILNEKIEIIHKSIIENKKKLNEINGIKSKEKDIIPNIEKVIELYNKLDNPSYKNKLLKETIEKAVYIKTEKNKKNSNKKNFKLIIYPRLPK